MAYNQFSQQGKTEKKKKKKKPTEFEFPPPFSHLL